MNELGEDSTVFFRFRKSKKRHDQSWFSGPFSRQGFEKGPDFNLKREAHSP